MATRKEMLASLGTLGQGLSVMQDRMQAAKSFEQEQKDKEAERQYLEQYRPKTLQAQDQTLERGKLGIEDDKLKLEGSQKLKAARDALDAQVAGEWSFVAPEDAGNVMGWKAELATLNREGNKAIAPQDYYRLKKESMAEDKRKQGKYESDLATAESARQAGRFTSIGTSSEGNALLMDAKRGKVIDSGVGKAQESSGRGRDGLTEQERRDKFIFQAKDKLRDVYEKTGTANAILMLNDIANKIGGIDGSSDIPGYGAGNIKPQATLSQEGKDVRTSLAGLRNIVLKDRSGAAVTNQEFERLKEEIGGGVFSTDADLRSKLKRMGEIVAQHAQNIDATFQGDPEVPKQAFDEYKRAGGVIASSLNLSGKKSAISREPDDPDSAFNSVYGQGQSGAKGGSSFDFSRFKK